IGTDGAQHRSTPIKLTIAEKASKSNLRSAVLALVILLPRWGVALLVMGGREMSAARRVKDWEPAGGFGNWPEGVAGGLSAVFSTGLRGAEGRRVWRTAFGHTSPGRSAPVRWAWRTGRFPTLAS